MKKSLFKAIAISMVLVMAVSFLFCGCGKKVALKLEIGNGEIEDSCLEFKVGDTIEKDDLPIPTKEMGLFADWYDKPIDEEGTKPVEFPYTIEEDTTFYAWWLEIEIEGSTDTDGLLD